MNLTLQSKAKSEAPFVCSKVFINGKLTPLMLYVASVESVRHNNRFSSEMQKHYCISNSSKKIIAV